MPFFAPRSWSVSPGARLMKKGKKPGFKMPEKTYWHLYSLQALNPEKYRITPIGISKSGRWYAGAEAMSLLKLGKDDPDAAVVLPADPVIRQVMRLGTEQSADYEPLDVIFPVIHGPMGEDGTLQGLLELSSPLLKR